MKNGIRGKGLHRQFQNNYVKNTCNLLKGEIVL